MDDVGASQPKVSPMRTVLFLAGALIAFAAPCRAQFAVEDADENGVVNPADFSWRYYLDKMNRSPDQIGIICVNAYWLDKTGDHASSRRFFEECARRGNAPAMIYLSTLHEQGLGTPRNVPEATAWLRRAAETGYALGQFHYGVALLSGRGVTRDEEAAMAWIGKAAAQGNVDALVILHSGYGMPSLAGSKAPLGER